MGNTLYGKFVLQATFQSEGAIHGFPRRTLKKALIQDWMMRVYRECMGYYVMAHHADAMMQTVNYLRHQGLPSMRHQCSGASPFTGTNRPRIMFATDTGADHIGHTTKSGKMTPAQVCIIICGTVCYNGCLFIDAPSAATLRQCPGGGWPRQSQP
jgi:hypothetical protein